MYYAYKLYVNDTSTSKLINTEPDNNLPNVVNNTKATIAVTTTYMYYVVPGDTYNYKTYNADKSKNNDHNTDGAVSVLLPSQACIFVTPNVSQSVESSIATRLANLDTSNTSLYSCSNNTNGVCTDIESMARTTSNPVGSNIMLPIPIPVINCMIINNFNLPIMVATSTANSDFNPNTVAIDESINLQPFTTSYTGYLKYNTYDTNSILYIPEGAQVVNNTNSIVIQSIDPKDRPAPNIIMLPDVKRQIFDDRDKDYTPPNNDLFGTNRYDARIKW